MCEVCGQQLDHSTSLKNSTTYNNIKKVELENGEGAAQVKFLNNPVGAKRNLDEPISKADKRESRNLEMNQFVDRPEESEEFVKKCMETEGKVKVDNRPSATGIGIPNQYLDNH